MKTLNTTIRKLSLFLLLVFALSTANGQNRTKWSYRTNKFRSFKLKRPFPSHYSREESGRLLAGTIGIAAGNENFISMVKMGGVAQVPLFKERTRQFKNDFYPFSLYAGGDLHMFVFFAGSFSASANTGLVLGPVTIDNGITRTVTLDPDGNVARRMTSLNPKVGLLLGPVWVKAGPSFPINGSLYFEDWIEVNEQPFNFEINYIFNWGVNNER